MEGQLILKEYGLIPLVALPGGTLQNDGGQSHSGTLFLLGLLLCDSTLENL
jgi:hypothetical protein